ncbi:MAG: hypothetical protein K2I42_05990 [Anaeroplasmataceae bacterium]|nr:hypothetical protein [Anaeroplasmataceae bacterium]
MDKWTTGLQLLSILNHYGYKSYIVGGAVRDYYLGNPILDVDITTNALPEELSQIFPQIEIVESYLSTRIELNHFCFEVTTFRKDIAYLDHRHPVVQAVQTIEEDLKRRDFTINALALDSSLNLIDLYNGLKDLNDKTIRCIGNPKLRFEEDAYRVLRAVELASRYNFDLDEQIKKSFSKDYVANLKEEYIISILSKILQAPYQKGLCYIRDFKLLRGYPFYQVVVEECLAYSCMDAYALFYCLHNFIPSNVKLSKEQMKRAKDISYFVRNEFSNEALYYGNKELLEPSIEIYNKIKKRINKSEVWNKYHTLPIQRIKDICFDFNTLDKSNIGVAVATIEKKLLNNELKNNTEDIALELRRIL